jgi:DNA polymerase-3 subunit beta
MELSIQSEILKDAINKLSGVIDRKISRPILTNCLVTIENKTLILSATDTEVSVKIVLNADSNQNGSFCINIKNFGDILRELPNDKLNLKIEKDKNLLYLNCGSINYSLVIVGAEEFPHLSFENSGTEFFLKSSDISRVINKVSHAISTDETRLYLNGIFFQQYDSTLRAVAIDGHRLAMLDIPEFISRSNFLVDGIIVPKKGVNELKKISDTYPSENLRFSVDDSFLYVNHGKDYYVSIRLISREYPKYQTVIPNKTTFGLQVEKNALLNAVKRIKILANEKTNGVKCTLKNNLLTVSTNHPSLGEAKEEIPIKYDGKEFNIGFNAKYLIDNLTVLSDTEITMEFNNELSPVVVKCHDMQDFLGIIMPLKI